MIIKSDSIKQITNILCDNILIKDKTIVIVNNSFLVENITENVLKYVHENNIKIDCRILSTTKYINNFIISTIIKEDCNKGLRVKNIIIYNENLSNEDQKSLENLIIGIAALENFCEI